MFLSKRIVLDSCPNSAWQLFEGNGYCYLFVETSLTWDNAQADCEDREANLVSIHSKAEDDFVTSKFQLTLFIYFFFLDNSRQKKACLTNLTLKLKLNQTKIAKKILLEQMEVKLSLRKCILDFFLRKGFSSSQIR